MILRVRCYKNLQQNFKKFAKSKAPTKRNRKKPPLLFCRETTILIQAHAIIQKV